MKKKENEALDRVTNDISKITKALIDMAIDRTKETTMTVHCTNGQVFFIRRVK